MGQALCRIPLEPDKKKWAPEMCTHFLPSLRAPSRAFAQIALIVVSEKYMSVCRAAYTIKSAIKPSVC